MPTALENYLALKRKEEEDRKKFHGQRPQVRVPQSNAQSLLGHIKEQALDPNIHPPENEPGGLPGFVKGALWDLPASFAYHGINSALMGVPGMTLPDNLSPYDLDEANTWAKVGGIIGEAAGFLIPIGVVGKAISAPIRALYGSGKAIKNASKIAASGAAATAVAREAAATTKAGILAKNLVPGYTGAGRSTVRFANKKAAKEALEETAEKSIKKTMDTAVDANSQNRGLLKKLFPNKPKKWLDRAYDPTTSQGVHIQRSIEDAVRAGLKKEFVGVRGMSDELIDETAGIFLKGLSNGKHLNTAGSWVAHAFGAGTPNWLRAKMAGYSGRFADMLLNFGVYNTIDEGLHRHLEEDYQPRGWGEIAGSTLAFAAVLPLIEAIPGGVKGAMTLKNLKDVKGILKRPKYGEMTKLELTTYYDYIKYKMPGRAVGTLDDSAMKMRKAGEPGVAREKIAEALDDWYTVARKDFNKMFVGEEAKNFLYSIPRMTAGALYFGGAIDEAEIVKGNFHKGFFHEGFKEHFKEDPWAVTTHMLTGMFFTKNRKPLSRDSKGRWENKIHFKEEYMEQLGMLQDMGLNADFLEYYFNSFSNADIRKNLMGMSYHQTGLGQDVTRIVDGAMQQAKNNDSKNIYNSKLDVIKDEALIEGYDIWSSSKASRIINSGDGTLSKIEGRDVLESLTREQRDAFISQIENLTTGKRKKDGKLELVKDTNWNSIRSDVFDKTVLIEHYDFFQNYLMRIAKRFGDPENAPEILDAGTENAVLIKLPRISQGSESDIGDLQKYNSIATRLVRQGKAEWATGTDMDIKAESLNDLHNGKTGHERLSEITNEWEEKYGENILGENSNIAIDFNRLDVTWETTEKLKERQIYEKLIKLVSGDVEGLQPKEARVYEIIKGVFGNNFSRDWMAYSGEQEAGGAEILRKGMKMSSEDWKNRSQSDKDEHTTIMKAVQLVHNLMSYTPLGKSANINPRDHERPKGVTLEEGRALVDGLKQSGLVGGLLPSGVLATNFRRYLFERAIHNMKLRSSDFALIQSVIDSKIALEPTMVNGQVRLVIPTPAAVETGLINELGAGHSDIRRLVETYEKLVYNRMMGFTGLVDSAGENVFYAANMSVGDMVKGNVKRILDITSFRGFLLDAAEVTEISLKESKEQLTAVIKSLQETELYSNIAGLEEMITSNETGNLEQMEGLAESLSVSLNARRHALSKEEISILDNLYSKLTTVVKNIKKDASLVQGSEEQIKFNTRTLVNSQDELGSAVTALDKLLDEGGMWKSKQTEIKLIGDLITNAGTDNLLKSTVAIKRLKQALLSHIKMDKNSAESLPEIIKRFEDRGLFSDFLRITRRELMGALDSLDKDQVDALNKEQTQAQSRLLAGIRELQFTISPNTIARKYTGTIFEDPKTRAFSEKLKQRIIASVKADLELGAGKVENIREVIDEMVAAIPKEHSSIEFITKELPKLLHTLVSTEKKELFQLDDGRGELVQGDTHGARGPIDNYITWWQTAINETHSKSNTPQMYITRLSRSAIIGGFLKDIDSPEGPGHDRVIDVLQRISSEHTAEQVSETNRMVEDGIPLEKILKAARTRGRNFDFITFGVDRGGHDFLVDMAGLNRVRDAFKEQATTWYNEKIKWLEEEYDSIAAKNFKGSFEDIIKRFERTDNVNRDDARDIIRHMYYERSNPHGHDALFLDYKGVDKDRKKSHAELFKYSGVAQGENSGRFSIKVAEALLDAESNHIGAWERKKLMGETGSQITEFVEALKTLEKKDWKFDVSVISDEGKGDASSLFSSDNLVKMVYNEMADKAWQKLLRKYNLDKYQFAEEFAMDLDDPVTGKPRAAIDLVESFIKTVDDKKPVTVNIAGSSIGVGDVLTYHFAGKQPILHADSKFQLHGKYRVTAISNTGFEVEVNGKRVALEKNDVNLNSFSFTGQKKKVALDIKRSAVTLVKDNLVKEISNIVEWRTQSLEELTKINKGVSAIDGVTYLSRDAARVIFGMNGFYIGEGFASVKPTISHTNNPFFGDEGVRETFIGKTNFVYDPRVAGYMDKAGIDIMMGKSAAKSFSGTVNDLTWAEGKLPTDFRPKNIFEKTTSLIDVANNFQLPLESIGVVYNAKPLHPSKVVPVAAIGMDPIDTKDYSEYMDIKGQLEDLAGDAVGLFDYKRTGIVNAIVEQAKNKGYDMDVGGGGIATQLFKLGMDASDPFLKREVISIFHKARGALIGSVEKPGAGVSVLIPEFDVRLPVYGRIAGNRRQTKYGGKKVPHEMGTRTGLFTDVNKINFLYMGDLGQDILFRDGDHIDPTAAKFLLQPNEIGFKSKEVKKLIESIFVGEKSFLSKAGVDIRELSVADIHQFFSLRFTPTETVKRLAGGVETTKYKFKIGTFRDPVRDTHLHIGDTESGILPNVRKILSANFKDFHTNEKLRDFTERLDEYDIGIAVPGLRIPSQSFGDVVISRLEGIYSKSFGNVVGANIFDVLTKHQGDFDVDKMFYYLDAPASLVHKGIRTGGYNVEPQSFPEEWSQDPVDLLNNNFGVGLPVSSKTGRDGIAVHKKNLVQNKYLIGRTNRLNYSLAMLRESGFSVGGLKDKLGMSNSFRTITPESEEAMGALSQRISNLASIILDPHKSPHKAAFLKDDDIMRYILFGDWKEINGPSPSSGPNMIGESSGKGLFQWIEEPGASFERNKSRIDLTQEHVEVVKDAYILALNTMGRAGRVFSGIFDETGQRAPQHWEYASIKSDIERFRKGPSKYIFSKLAWKYRKNENQSTVLFDLFVRHNTTHYGDIRNAHKDWREGNFNYKAIDPSFMRHNYMDTRDYNDFYNLTPALRVLDGLTNKYDNRSLYESALEVVNKKQYAIYSNEARDLIDAYVLTRSFTGEVRDEAMKKIWANAEARIEAPGVSDGLQQQQKRDILWQVLENELKSKDRYLMDLKGNRHANQNDVLMTSNSIKKLTSLLDHVQEQSLHNKEYRDKLLLDEHDKSWANVDIIKSGKGGTWVKNPYKHDIVIYEVDMSVDESRIKLGDDLTYKMLKGGQRIKKTTGGSDEQSVYVGANKKYVILKNPIRRVSINKDEFLHGLSAFAATTTLTPESLRAPVGPSKMGAFYEDIDYVRNAIKDYGKSLKTNLKENPNRKSMAFATNNWKVNDLLRILVTKYVDTADGVRQRKNRLTDIFELLTMVEPLHGAEAQIPGFENISIPVFIQNRDIVKGVSGFYINVLGSEGKEVVGDYFLRKSAFYRSFTMEQGDFNEVEKGLKYRLYTTDTRILPEHLEILGKEERIVYDIINTPLRKFSDLGFRLAFQSHYGVRDEQLQSYPNVTRSVARPWSSEDGSFLLETYGLSSGTDPLGIQSRATTYGERIRDSFDCAIPK